jgi:actin-related protein
MRAVYNEETKKSSASACGTLSPWMPRVHPFALVLDVGTTNTRCGLGGERRPRCVLESCVPTADLHRSRSARAAGEGQYVWPIQEGICIDWDAWEALVERAIGHTLRSLARNPPTEGVFCTAGDENGGNTPVRLLEKRSQSGQTQIGEFWTAAELSSFFSGRLAAWEAKNEWTSEHAQFELPPRLWGVCEDFRAPFDPPSTQDNAGPDWPVPAHPVRTLPVLLSERTLNPMANREKAIQILFETFGVDRAGVFTQPFLEAVAGGLGEGQWEDPEAHRRGYWSEPEDTGADGAGETGLVVSAGGGIVSVAPLLGGYVLPHAVMCPSAPPQVTMFGIDDGEAGECTGRTTYRYRRTRARCAGEAADMAFARLAVHDDLELERSGEPVAASPHDLSFASLMPTLTVDASLPSEGELRHARLLRERHGYVALDQDIERRLFEQAQSAQIKPVTEGRLADFLLDTTRPAASPDSLLHRLPTEIRKMIANYTRAAENWRSDPVSGLAFGPARYLWAEGLFSNGVHMASLPNAGTSILAEQFLSSVNKTLPEMVVESVEKLDTPDLREAVARRIVLCGGITLTHGFASRLTKELKDLRPALPWGDPQESRSDFDSRILDLVDVPRSACDDQTVCGSPPDDRLHSVFVGGSLVASFPQFFQQRSFDSHTYDENGPSMVHRRCYT